MEERKKHLKEKLSLLPANPGCYLMKDKNGHIIYVGKAKVLKNRVKSYFTGSHDVKTTRLVSEIYDFEYIVTSSNVECLILENNLIKQHTPKYNILLKDDKHYPYLKITNETHPRLLISRGVKKDGAKYFGPYPSSGAASEVKELLDRLYPLRKCTKMPKKVCLYYHIGQCLAPCEFNVSKEQNQTLVEEISRFLNGDTKEVVDELHQKMNQASEKLDFERAKEYRDMIASIHQITEKQKVDLLDLSERDVFGFYYEKGWMCVQVFFIRQGVLIERESSVFSHYGDPEEDFYTFIGQFYQHHQPPKEILLPKELDAALVSEYLGTKTFSPQRGKKKELVHLASKNAQVALKEKFALLERDEDRTFGAIETLGAALNIGTPYRIEMFDNSNMQGSDPVSAMVVFLNGKATPKEYRKFHIKSVTGPDDYASMKEVITRRYGRLQKEGKAFPDLILVDGGKGQLSVAQEALHELGVNVPVAGVAKDDRHRTSELLYGNPIDVVPLERNSDAFYLLARIQDEVHRFAITFFRKQNKKTAFKSFLDDIEGIGEKRKKALLKTFKTKENMRNASVEEYQQIGIPKKLAETIKDRLND